jgi:hypothetical protein
MELDEDKYEAMEQQLELIRDIGFDFDGYSTAEDLKSLIDELVGYAKDGLKGIRPKYVVNGKVQVFIKGKPIDIPKEEWDEEIKSFMNWFSKKNKRKKAPKDGV